MTSPGNDDVTWKWKVRDANEAAHLFVFTGGSPEEEPVAPPRETVGFPVPFETFPCDVTSIVGAPGMFFTTHPFLSRAG